jgi:ABC-type branched-subunit amino acid transport system ATPase component
LLKRIAAQGLTILIIDHDMTLVSEAAQHITVLNFGRRIADGESPRCCAIPMSSPPISEPNPMPLLEINDLIVRYGEIEALRGVSLSVERGRW